MLQVPLKWGSLNFPSFSSFRIGSIAQNKNPELPELLNFLESLNWICKFRSTWNFLGISCVSLKIFKIPYMVLFWWHSIVLYVTHVIFILVWNFQEKIFYVNIFLTFTAVQNILRHQRSKKYEKMASKASHFS